MKRLEKVSIGKRELSQSSNADDDPPGKRREEMKEKKAQFLASRVKVRRSESCRCQSFLTKPLAEKVEEECVTVHQG